MGDISNILVDRFRPTADIARKIFAFATKRGLTIGGDVIDYKHSVALEMDLDEDILAEDADSLASDYLLYVLNDGEVGVSCLTLYKYSRDRQWPVFSSWRKGLTVQGYYHLYKGVAYLIGHVHNAAYPRLITLWTDAHLPSGHRFGTIASATPMDYSMFSWCYIKPTDSADLRKDEWRALGHFSLDRIATEAPEVGEFFAQRSPVSVPLRRDVL